MTRPITSFSNPHITVTHDPLRGGAVHPETGQRIEGLGDFFRELHAQRRAHRETGVPYAITQRIVAGEAAGAEEEVS